MHVLGVGTDIVEVLRIASMIEKHEARFLNRAFTPAEIQYCAARSTAYQHYAGRWAAKEAVVKCLGTHGADRIRWTDIEIESGPNRAPSVRLTGWARELAKRRGVGRILISLTHCRHYAAATAIALADEPAT